MVVVVVVVVCCPQYFLLPLQQKVAEGVPWISSSEVSAIFGPLEIIYATSLDVIIELEERYQHWPEQQLFGDVFLKLVCIRSCTWQCCCNAYHSYQCQLMVGWVGLGWFGLIWLGQRPVMNLYSAYVNNYDTSNQTLLACREVPEFTAFLREQAALGGVSHWLEALLIMPVQRLPRYQLFIQELIKYTEPTHVDYSNLLAALEAIKSLNAGVNERKKDLDNRNKLLELQEAIIDAPMVCIKMPSHHSLTLATDA
jgi:hypothetical protein